MGCLLTQSKLDMTTAAVDELNPELDESSTLTVGDKINIRAR